MIRVRLRPDLKAKWEGVLTGHKITQQAAVVAFVEWLVIQDPLTRSMIFGQVPDTDRAALSRIVLERLGQGVPKAKAKR
jgi:hypothetical protein